MSSERYWGRGRPDLPVYGPTDPFGDEEHEPEVIVRVDFLMSREQLEVALGIAWAEIAGDRNAESLTVAEVRHEVEAFLSVQAFFALDQQMEQDRQRVFPPEQQRVLRVLADAVAQAYPDQSVPSRPAARPATRNEDGTVTVETDDHGPVTFTEPAWCAGGHVHGVSRADISHEGPDAAAVVDGMPFLRANLTHAPYLAEEPEPHPVAYVEGVEAGSFDAAGLADLADSLVAFAVGPLHQLVERLQLLEGGES